MSDKSDKIPMHYGASPYLFKYAKELRNHSTKAEALLWEKLSRKQLGVKFRRQHPVYKYIADFYCHELKLVIEVDGGYHNQSDQKEYDTFRSEDLTELKITVLRFTNEQIFQNIDKVVDRINQKIESLINNKR